ncbi:DUF433 domain-containing protein [Microcystis aeruginosa BLCCF158]|uniref:DUF433 domain-containing protein n=1 Tax=Microcystis aeruginosa BLCC-F158 TaxID=2755316 RepID=A0A841V7Y2_MICAE|nr:DUF433 domain-containing protein [Microcystis aeruginosa]MBC1196927.1 DUF433 domain-containing protein [Microcystis aeruginosa BLCC-F158]
MTTATDIGTLVTRSPDIGKDRLVITGTGTSVRRVVVLYKQGASAEEIARRMSHLSLAQVYAALAYYHANRDEIEADLAEEDAEYWKLALLHGKKAFLDGQDTFVH